MKKDDVIREHLATVKELSKLRDEALHDSGERIKKAREHFDGVYAAESIVFSETWRNYEEAIRKEDAEYIAALNGATE